ncbi:leukotriene B4 receptor 1-like [Salvelinus fontinalis]|uniref:Leukotriene B4 receptor 1-like n=1 Tax=Salvelinus namaycush TaxID=8040 RepID=A0A8U0PMU8_SALNM|nr:leukotriene B4 receptor 1-like [Salvelinus namaycush]XP_055750185.1 leukotriene B4 receptor 1-like [Salvelinus fontinalis]
MVNMNSSSNSSLDSTSPDSGRLISSTVLGLCCALGLPGNIAVLVVILRRSSRRPNFTLCLMLNLASSDILCLATVPVWIYTLLHGWTLGRAACKLATFLLYLSLYANVLTVTLLGVQRYLQVLYPQMWNRLGRKGEVVLLLALWGLACALTAPAVATRDVRNGELKCQRHTGSDAERVAVLVLETLLGFVIPFSVLVTSYCCLHRRVNQTALFSSAKLTRLVTSVVVAFFILWIPVHIVNVVDIAGIVLQTSWPEASAALLSHRSAAARVVRSFTFFNSCLDPFLYAFASRRIREQPKSSSRGDSRMQVTNI